MLFCQLRKVVFFVYFLFVDCYVSFMIGRQVLSMARSKSGSSAAVYYMYASERNGLCFKRGSEGIGPSVILCMQSQTHRSPNRENT
jgi:hypothetical protein